MNLNDKFIVYINNRSVTYSLVSFAMRYESTSDPEIKVKNIRWITCFGSKSGGEFAASPEEMGCVSGGKLVKEYPDTVANKSVKDSYVVFGLYKKLN